MADEAAPFEESTTAHAVDALTPTASPGASPVQPVALNFPLVLRYLQSEFRAFDWERSEWDLERAELHVGGVAKQVLTT